MTTAEKGITVFESDFVDIFNNTVYRNNKDTQNTGTWRGGLSVIYSNDVLYGAIISVLQSQGPGVLAMNRG